jgi:predicted double-glycine peptidase
MAAIAFVPFSKEKSDSRTKLFIGAALSLIPILAKMTFSILPMLEARLMPVDFYTVIQREFWLPFTVLFFALASHLVPSKSRKGVLAIVIILVLVVAQQTYWRLQEPDIYDYKGKVTDGVCQQTSFDTCGAASMVTLLNKMGVQSSEGEMARLAMAAPGKGISPHQAAYALRRKLEQVGRSEIAVLLVPDLKDLHDLPKPFLAGIKFSFRTNHMVCVMETTQDNLVVGDPISIGPKKWSWENFSKIWSGIVIVCNKNNDTF